MHNKVMKLYDSKNERTARIFNASSKDYIYAIVSGDLAKCEK